jgi:UDP-N-acetylglucosamine diphosphorylase/glucosamine-1-phosphate N-acetyltransferase
VNIILFDDESRRSLLPLTDTRPIAEIRIGILKIREKWEKYLNGSYSYLTESYIQPKYPLNAGADNFLINGSVSPDANLVNLIQNLRPGQCIVKGEILIAGRTNATQVTNESLKSSEFSELIGYDQPLMKISNNWDIFSMNEKALKDDFALITKGRKSAVISKSNRVLGEENIFLEPGAKVECAMLNAKDGPIYIGNDAEVMEGAMIRGPFALCEHSQVKMGAKIYGGTTIGPHCKVGGEISNSVVFGYSNKAHDGFLGNSVLGEWCNLGADSNNSNLKNNYSKIKVWNYKEEAYVNSGLQFCGLIMGDHSKCSINTMFNTGTVVGVSANIFGNGFPPKFVPSFAWGGSEGFTTYRIEDALEVAQRVYERRHLDFDATEQKLLRSLFDITTKYRAW